MGKRLDNKSEKARLRGKILKIWGIKSNELNELFPSEPGVCTFNFLASIADRCPNFTEARRLLTETRKNRLSTAGAVGKQRIQSATFSDVKKVKEVLEARKVEVNGHGKTGGRASVSRLAKTKKASTKHTMQLRKKKVGKLTACSKQTKKVAKRTRKNQDNNAGVPTPDNINAGHSENPASTHMAIDPPSIPFSLSNPQEWLDIFCISQLLKMVAAVRPSIYVVDTSGPEISASDLLRQPMVELILLLLQVEFKHWVLAAIPFNKIEPVNVIKLYHSFEAEAKYDSKARKLVQGFLEKVHASWPQGHAHPSPAVKDFTLALETCPMLNEPRENGVIAIMAAIHAIAGKKLPEKADLAAWRRLLCHFVSESAGNYQALNLFPALREPSEPIQTQDVRKKRASLKAYLDASTKYDKARESYFVTALQMQSILAWFETNLEPKIEEMSSWLSTAKSMIQEEEKMIARGTGNDAHKMELQSRYDACYQEYSEAQEMLLRVQRCRKVVYESLKAGSTRDRPHLGDLSALLQDGKVTSVDLVSAYLAQIEKHNRNSARLNAVINAVSKEKLFGIARQLDSKRSEIDAASKPLYGIPFLIKDNIWTAETFGVPTTSGAVAFEKAIAKDNAPIVQKVSVELHPSEGRSNPIVQQLIDAGMIMLAKTNLNELAAMKTMSLTGWSALGGQTQSAYVEGGVIKGEPFLGHSTPGGSSTGSAVGVSAGMAPVALGTETDGSIVVPSDRASLYSVKITIGGVSTNISLIRS
ncbi:amidase signature domain-containing protein [Apiosordaria backusii]|uniref:Amidase signature domain-containing protein n=1 Tax=Apiosordaria backusii TaxID=314023 RepID=A0AA39ZRW2_9PEZI|nr:amidase signature domain-containing protein [Apiosordaria backusii]